jgi:hypothetical protein
MRMQSIGAGIVAGGLSLGLAACLFSDGGGSKPVPGGGVPVELQIRESSLSKSAGSAAVALTVDSVHVRVTAPDMEPAEFSFRGNDPSLSITELKPGENRLFEARLFLNGTLLYAGSATASLHTDRVNTLALHCLPQFSRVSASVHIPAAFPRAIAGGRMTLWNAQDTFSAGQTVNGELRNFRLERVPGDRSYSISLVLWGAAGDTLAVGHRNGAVIPMGQNVALVMPLAYTFPQLQLSMTVGDPGATTVLLHFPAGRRTPTAFGEVVFSELYPAPAAIDSSDNGEWLELFNRHSDTLDVSGCQLARDAGSGTGMQYALPAGTVIAPGRGLVVGRSAVSFAGVRMTASPLTLTNTAARLEFSCAGVKLDSVSYATSGSETAARLAAGKVTALKPSRIASRHAADAWCLASMRPDAGETAATPGGLFGSCGE